MDDRPHRAPWIMRLSWQFGLWLALLPALIALLAWLLQIVLRLLPLAAR